jgi:hypothetical protein
MSNSLPRKQSVVISERSPKPAHELAFMKLTDVYGNKDDEIFENPMNRSVPLNYLKYEDKNTIRDPYYNEIRSGKLGGKTRRRTKYNKKSRRGGKGGKYRKSRKSRKSRRGSKSRK